ncbi:hypothetical protein [Bacillus sp. SG-1]|uniref:hypothetical protein n=1 Tax=Bacillus sp. SG-1 TaxID=161544 RepID=UPI00015441D1|nr:hypothetical protein [Bacillus sp. SG-1]EDL66440.1 hypothetical protein BSG1_03770 [Bacillus sp. SG-1]
MQFSLTILMVLTAMSSGMPEDTRVTTELQTREVVIEEKTLNQSWSEEESKHQYNVQFNERGFYQVAHVFSETEYGSSKETQIYFDNGDEQYLVSRHEFTKENILPSKFEDKYVEELDELPFINE